jgi:eukaryotic-like serine/threonine-protein kinase
LLEIMRTSRVAKYEIVDEIGHGGMATVYRARDTRLDRFVALKVMHPHLQGAKEARARFAREALTIARLKHPNILEIYDYSGEDSEISYIATELLTGPTLKQLVDQHPDMPAEVAACLAILVARALGAAHAEGVIHRDVKPENVMMHENREVKLTDFGIAQLVDVQGMTTTGQVLGSPAHMAPEQIEGRECDARSDIFSLGTVLYLLATGELPFQGKNPHQVLKQIAEGQFRDPLMVKPQIGGRLRSVLLRCLHVDPSKRYDNARALEADLNEFVAAANIDNPGEFIAQYLKGTRAFSQAFRSRIVDTEVLLGERAMKVGDVPRAMDAFNRVLSIDESNERVLIAVRRLGRRSQLRRAGFWISGAVMLCGLIAYFASALTATRPNPPAAGEPVPPPREISVPAQAPSAPPEKKAGPQTAAPVPAVQPLAAAGTRRPERRTRNGKPGDESAPGGSGPRHVVLRPEPANVSISIDGALPRDFGPSFRELTLAPGPHVFKFVGAHDCCVPAQVTIDIPPGPGTTIVAQRLTFRPAVLYVVSNTPANVVVDGGAVRGRTRSMIPVPQPDDMFGTHVITVSAEGYQEVVREVRLRAGQVETISVELPEKSADPAPPG